MLDTMSSREAQEYIREGYEYERASKRSDQIICRHYAERLDRMIRLGAGQAAIQHASETLRYYAERAGFTVIIKEGR